MGFKDLNEFFKPGLQLPIRGKTYTIPSVNAEDGLRLRLLFSDPSVSLTDEGELKEIMTLLGAEWVPKIETVNVTDPTTGGFAVDKTGEVLTTEADRGSYQGGIYQEMADDGLSWEEIIHAGKTALFNAGLGRTLAEVFWETGLAEDDSGNSVPPKPGGDSRARVPEQGHEAGSEEGGTEENGGEEGHLRKGRYGLFDPRPKAYGEDDPGGGDYDPVTGMRDWYSVPRAPLSDTAARITWPEILEQWVFLAHDLFEVYGIDVESGILRERPWKWFEDKVIDLLFRGPRLTAWRSLRTGSAGPGA
ncbi:tail assembly chaperone [Gordonia phage Madeline]|uniref:Tail assembly chaperone n=1 Tax=Gordonia phage Madeline TaxID=2591189 RepID=A0A514A2X8_9CAUD|nr:tail assembly chaperone [Gordonia phage Madeline]QDH47619.1 tail assembly chaperone [Gordonia phage Madeline]